MEAKVEDVADHGNRGFVDAIDARGTPRFKPRIVGDVVAQDSSIFRCDVGHVAVHCDISKEGGWQAVGAVVRGATTRCSVEDGETSAIEREGNMAGADGEREDFCR